MSTSYPYLNVARNFCADYGTVLHCATAIEQAMEKDPVTGFPTVLDFSKNDKLQAWCDELGTACFGAIFDAVGREHTRRAVVRLADTGSIELSSVVREQHVPEWRTF